METVPQVTDAVVPLCINFETVVYRLENTQISRYLRDRVETVLIVTNLHIVSGKYTLCIAWKQRKDAAHQADVHYCLVHPFSMMCYVQTRRFISSEMGR